MSVPCLQSLRNWSIGKLQATLHWQPPDIRMMAKVEGLTAGLSDAQWLLGTLIPPVQLRQLSKDRACTACTEEVAQSANNSDSAGGKTVDTPVALARCDCSGAPCDVGL